MNNKLWNEFIEGKAVVNCKTKDEAEKFLKICEGKNIRWVGEGLATDHNNWDTYKESTCYINSHKDFRGIQFSPRKFYEDNNSKIVTYTELMEEKNTFTGPELAQAILDGKFKKGVKFKDNEGIEVKIEAYRNTNQLTICESLNPQLQIPIFSLINRTFTLIEEPKLYYFNQAKTSEKKIKLKGWDKFYTLQEALKILSDYDSVVINEAFNKKVWEVEE